MEKRKKINRKQLQQTNLYLILTIIFKGERALLGSALAETNVRAKADLDFNKMLGIARKEELRKKGSMKREAMETFLRSRHLISHIYPCDRQDMMHEDIDQIMSKHVREFAQLRRPQSHKPKALCLNCANLSLSQSRKNESVRLMQREKQEMNKIWKSPSCSQFQLTREKLKADALLSNAQMMQEKLKQEAARREQQKSQEKLQLNLEDRALQSIIEMQESARKQAAMEHRRAIQQQIQIDRNKKEEEKRLTKSAINCSAIFGANRRNEKSQEHFAELKQQIEEQKVAKEREKQRCKAEDMRMLQQTNEMASCYSSFTGTRTNPQIFDEMKQLEASKKQKEANRRETEIKERNEQLRKMREQATESMKMKMSKMNEHVNYLKNQIASRQALERQARKQEMELQSNKLNESKRQICSMPVKECEGCHKQYPEKYVSLA